MGPMMNYPGNMAYPALYQNGSYAQGNPISQQPYMQQSQPSYPASSSMSAGIHWVDGEVGAKAFQLPAGWPANTPIDLWDTNDCVIYLKSINQLGMPNPLQKVHYTMDEPQQQSNLMTGNSNSVMSSDYVTKEDMKNMEDRLMSAFSSSNASSSNTGDRRMSNGQNRNGGGKE